MPDRSAKSLSKHLTILVYQTIGLMFISRQTLAGIRNNSPQISSGILTIILPVTLGTAGSVIFRTADFLHVALTVVVGTIFALLGWLIVGLILYIVNSKLFQAYSSYSDILATTSMCYGPAILQVFMFINPISAAIWAVSWMWILVIHIPVVKALANHGYIRAWIATSLGWGLWMATQYYLMWAGIHPINWL